MKIGTTSFIKKAERYENVQYLSALVDEVELLYFDSMNDYDFPDDEEIDKLKKIDMDFNVHLPADRDLSEKSGWDVVNKFIKKLDFLNPVSYTVHPSDNKDSFISGLAETVKNTETPVLVENITDDLSCLEPAVDVGAGICMDVGHLILYCIEIDWFINKFADDIKLIHFHGVKDGMDHSSLKYLDKEIFDMVVKFASVKELTLCMEVFNEEDFSSSVKVMGEYIEQENYPYNGRLKIR